MSKLKLIILGLVLFASSVAFANIRVNTYRHQPCSNWSFDGTCSFYDFSRIAAEGRSVQRAIALLDQKISNLEIQMQTLEEENMMLKEKLNSK